MNFRKPLATLFFILCAVFASQLLTSCSSTSSSAHMSVGYGFGIGDPYFYDPWYSRPPVVVAPPPHRPVRPPMGRPGRPTTLPGRL